MTRKSGGVRVTAETGPHYFSLTEAQLLRRDADYRMNPPLRTEKGQARHESRPCATGRSTRLRRTMRPTPRRRNRISIRRPNGSIGLETSLAAGITALVKPGYLTLMELLSKMTIAPAQILGIPAGTLKTDAAADVVLFDENAEWTVDPAKLHGKSRNTPFKGMRLTGRVKMTVCGGRIVYEDAENA